MSEMRRMRINLAEGLIHFPKNHEIWTHNSFERNNFDLMKEYKTLLLVTSLLLL
jgi:hypothetical protein